MSSENVVDHLRQVEMFKRLSDAELQQIGALCQVQRVAAGARIFSEGDDGDELFIILDGSVRVALNTRIPESGRMEPSTINMLYTGQSFGEMVLLGGATRSASVSALDACILLIIRERDFAKLCDSNPRIGYQVMRNIATDLAYKLRSSNLLLRGNIRWQKGELGRRRS